MTFEIQAHRGARAFYPENTLEAFRKAADLGCPVIELDLAVSQDHQLVVSHDLWIPDSRFPQSGRRRKRLLYDMPYEEIAAYDCGMVSPDFPEQIRIHACKPRLGEVFASVERHLGQLGRPGAMIYNLEVKSLPGRDGIEHPSPDLYAALVMDAIQRSGLVSRIRVQSFDYRILQESNRLDRRLSYGLLIDTPGVLQPMLGRLAFAPEYVNPRVSLLDGQFVEALHDEGFRVVAWTVNSRVEMLRMKRIGADGIITDHPELALSLEELS
jgi:glycerophosphoryl diester phosphodiesterase